MDNFLDCVSRVKEIEMAAAGMYSANILSRSAA
jgi:hypothetical protein